MAAHKSGGLAPLQGQHLRLKVVRSQMMQLPSVLALAHCARPPTSRSTTQLMGPCRDQLF